MKRINFDYKVYQQNGIVLTGGHFNYSLSHYIYALYQSQLALGDNPSHFWSSLKKALSSINIGNLYFLFTDEGHLYGGPLESGAKALLHAMGYFAFGDIIKAKPTFVYRPLHGKNRLCLSDQNAYSGMVFLKNKPVYSPFQRVYAASFEVNNHEPSLLFDDKTFHLNILDPEYSPTISWREDVKEVLAKEQAVLERLKANGGCEKIEWKTHYGTVRIAFSLSKPEIEDDEYSFSDGKITVFAAIEEAPIR